MDLNRDGYRDLVITNSGGNNILVCLGRKSGGFEDPRPFDAGMSPVGLTVAYLNEDGLPDLVVANELSNDVSVWLVDLIVSNGVSNNSFLFPGRGGGFFAEPILFRSAGPIVTGQFDLSPGIDVAFLNSSSHSVTLYSSLAFPDFEPGSPLSYRSGGLGPIAGLADDFNYDGFDDLIIANNGDGSVSLLWGGADGFGQTLTLLTGLPPLTDLELLDAGSQGLLNLVATAEGDDVPLQLTVRLPGFPELLPPGGSEFGLRSPGIAFLALFGLVFSPASPESGAFDPEAFEGAFLSPDGSGGGANADGPEGPEGQPDPLWRVLGNALEKGLEPIQDDFKKVIKAIDEGLYRTLEHVIVTLNLPIAPDDVYDVVGVAWSRVSDVAGTAWSELVGRLWNQKDDAEVTSKTPDRLWSWLPSIWSSAGRPTSRKQSSNIWRNTLKSSATPNSARP